VIRFRNKRLVSQKLAIGLGHLGILSVAPLFRENRDFGIALVMKWIVVTYMKWLIVLQSSSLETSMLPRFESFAFFFFFLFFKVHL